METIINNSASNSVYEQQFREQNLSLNPVIVIPGILGSKLVDAEKSSTIWGDFRAKSREDRSASQLSKVALPMQPHKRLHELVSTTTSDGSMRHVKASIAGLPVQVNVYAGLMDAMGIGTGSMGGSLNKLDDYIDDMRFSANAFEFAYDWRRSLDENAIELGRYIHQITRFIRMYRADHNPVKFDIVAHSMGGLIARYFLRYGEQLIPNNGSLPIANWAGSAQIERVIIIGTPNAGSLFALERLVAGFPSTPVTPGYDPMYLGTMPAVYQLLPRIRHKTFHRSDSAESPNDFLSLGFWVDMNWGLANKDRDDILQQLLPGIDSPQTRRETALEHIEKCLKSAKTIQLALDSPTKIPEHLKMFLFAGDSVPTPLIASAKSGDKHLTIHKKGAGDGTVSRASALLDERVGSNNVGKVITPLSWENVVFLSNNHLGLTKDPLCIKNILYILLERP